MVPDVAASNPAISFNSVNLPQPLAPTNATVAPRGTSSETPSTARVTRPFATYSSATSDSVTATPPLTGAPDGPAIRLSRCGHRGGRSREPSTHGAGWGQGALPAGPW